MKKLPMKELVHVAGMLVVLAVGVRCAGPGAEPDSHPELTTEGGLLVSDRDALRVCLELDESLADRGDEIAARIEESLGKLHEHPDWEKALYGAEPVHVERGCPEAKLPEGALSAKDSIVGPGLTDHPSPYRTQIHVIDDDRAKELLGDREAGRAIAELMKLGDHTVAEVSSALVLRASAIDGPALTERWLPMGLGLSFAEDEVKEADSLPKATDTQVEK